MAWSLSLSIGIFVVFSSPAFIIAWRRWHKFDGCCPAPPGGLWVCAHRKYWQRTSRGWRRRGKRRFIRLAVKEMQQRIEREHARHWPSKLCGVERESSVPRHAGRPVLRAY